MIRFVCYNCGAINEFEPEPDVSSYIVNCVSCELSSLVQNKGADDWTVEPYNENSSEVEDDYYGRGEGESGIPVDYESAGASDSRDEVMNSNRGGGDSGIDIDDACERGGTDTGIKVD